MIFRICDWHDVDAIMFWKVLKIIISYILIILKSFIAFWEGLTKAEDYTLIDYDNSLREKGTNESWNLKS